MSSAPKARVNIALNLETHGAKSETQLPLKLLVLGQFSGKTSNQRVSTRTRHRINVHNLNDTLRQLAPSLSLGGALSFKSMADFSPAGVVRQVPALQRLLAMRDLLRELKANLSDNPDLRRCLTRLCQESDSLSALKDQLPQLAPIKEVQG
ncbi:MAG: type VI secretion system-associated protein [marine bacterium B5-7]|nr:MAG: type VI secretion system-associated protein [marine bacterium B5-7]